MRIILSYSELQPAQRPHTNSKRLISYYSSSLLLTINPDRTLADSDDGPTDTPISSPHARPSQWKKRKVAPPGSAATTNTAIKSTSIVQDDEDEDEDVAPMARPIRQRVRSGFIVNSSDEE